jgi:hypothetical protein
MFKTAGGGGNSLDTLANLYTKCIWVVSFTLRLLNPGCPILLAAEGGPQQV